MSYKVEDIPSVIEFAKRVRRLIEKDSYSWICVAAFVSLKDSDHTNRQYRIFKYIIDFGLSRDPTATEKSRGNFFLNDWLRKYNDLPEFKNRSELLYYFRDLRLMWIDKIISDLEKYQSEYSKK